MTDVTGGQEAKVLNNSIELIATLRDLRSSLANQFDRNPPPTDKVDGKSEAYSNVLDEVIANQIEALRLVGLLHEFTQHYIINKIA